MDVADRPHAGGTASAASPGCRPALAEPPRVEPVVAAAAPALTRTAALLVPLVVPLAVTPWGLDGYSHVKSLVLVTLTGLALAGLCAARVLGRPAPWRETPAEVAALGYLLAALVATAASEAPRLSLLGAPGRHEGVAVLAAYALLYLIGVQAFGQREGVERLTAAAAAGGTLVVAYGLLQPFVPPLFAGEAFLRDWYSSATLPRVTSTVGGPVVFGGYTAFLLPLLLAKAAGDRRALAPLWTVSAAGAVIALALTLTRGAWIAAAVGLTLVAALVFPATPRRGWLAVVLMGAVVAAALLLHRGWVPPGGVLSRVASTAAIDTGSVAQRLYTWRATLGLIRQRPLTGWGPETLGEVFPYDRASLVRVFGARPVIIDRAHNEVLHAAVTLGVPGAATLVLFWVLAAAAAYRLWARGERADRILVGGWLGALAAYVVQAQFAFSTPGHTPLLWLLAGAVCGWAARR